MTWEAHITYRPGPQSLPETEIVCGPLRALECHIRKHQDEVQLVVLHPVRS